ncbi:MAG: precorrin-3B C(17)-methyltransferase [Candidatus Methanoperedens sp.]|nr:precorrin-3B C(17)-methyltransferase [Candidatus Methanoperedens sp.]
MLIGIGLGPGNPDLLTLAAVKALKESRKVYVPGKMAAELVAPYAKADVLDFPMIQDEAELSKLWETNAGIVAREAEKGTVSFAVIGDPNFFSTFSHLRRTIKEKYPHIGITTIPGVSAITAQASRTNISIEGSFIVSDGSPADTKIILKTKNPQKAKEELTKEGFNDFIYAERLFMGNENVTCNIPEKGDYFSMLVARRYKPGILPKGKLYIVGIGPGAVEQLTGKAKNALAESEYIIGNGTYLDQIAEITKNSKIIRSGMGGEIERARKAVELGRDHVVSIISGGDANVYGMAGLVLEVAEKEREIDIEVIPGVTALSAAASLLGAPLVNDFSVISLSDLLTGIETIKHRLNKAAEADFAIAIYNPKSRNRRHNFEGAIEIIRKYRNDNTPVGIVKDATREGETVIATTLGRVMEYNDIIDMSTIVLIGNSESRLWDNRIITPRGYQRKYAY